MDLVIIPSSIRHICVIMCRYVLFMCSAITFWV